MNKQQHYLGQCLRYEERDIVVYLASNVQSLRSRIYETYKRTEHKSGVHLSVGEKQLRVFF